MCGAANAANRIFNENPGKTKKADRREKAFSLGSFFVCIPHTGNLTCVRLSCVYRILCVCWAILCAKIDLFPNQLFSGIVLDGCPENAPAFSAVKDAYDGQ